MRSALSAGFVLLASVATAAPLPKEFQGAWHAVGECSEQNAVPGGYITVGPQKLQGHEFTCDLSAVKEVDDRQNRQVTLHRTCHSNGHDTEADVRLYVAASEIFGETLITVNQDGSFLTLYRRCPETGKAKQKP